MTDQYLMDLKKHQHNVAKYSELIARNLKLPYDAMLNLLFAAQFHDVGKLKIPKEILNKPEKLTKEEMEIMKQHSLYGAEYLKKYGFEKDVIEGVLYHHERYDGSGYPDGLKRNDIPLFSRIIAVADSFDAMTSDRPYKKALSVEEAIKSLKDCKGSQFDPEIIKIFLEEIS